MNRLLRILLPVLLLASGVMLWRVYGKGEGITRGRLIALAVALAVALVPPARDFLSGLLDRVRTPSDRARFWTAVGVAVVAMIYIYATARYQDRDLIPKFHDEHMHLLQIRMLAHGKLWTQPHPMRDFFETFHVIHDDRVYGSIYFPGTALVYLPWVWFKLPFWFLPLVVAGAACGVLYRIVAELIDGAGGLLAALLLVSLQWFRYLALMVMSHSVMLLLGLLILWAWLRWRRERKLAWAAVIGALMGLAAITRPVDALCYSLPVGVAMLGALRHESAKRIAATLSLLVACALPFLGLQVIENLGITGQPFKTPYRLYADLYTPGMSYGFHTFDPTVRPQTTLQQRQDYFDAFTVPAARTHAAVVGQIVGMWFKHRFPLMAKVATPNRLLLILVPLCVLAVATARRKVMVAVLVLWLAFYAVFSYVLPVYVVVIAPVILLCVLLGKEAAERLVASEPYRRAATVFLTLAVGVLTVAALPEVDHEVIDDGFPAPTMWFSYVELPKIVPPGERALVLFRYQTGENYHEEPVYNVDVVNIDDARIVRAHDLGLDRDRELFDYYARRQPDRLVYLFDRHSRKVVPLGRVADVARQFPLSHPATQPSTRPIKDTATADDAALHRRGPSIASPM
jgi:4-amino-4-deoxy-L-arabinose transferase-like glycosyltransferase